MATDLEVFRDTMAHKRPERVLYGASFTPDLAKRVREHLGLAEDDPEAGRKIAERYGFKRFAEPSMERPASDPPKDYSRYWAHRELPPGTEITSIGTALVPSGFHHFMKFVSPLEGAASLKEIEEYPLDDLSKWDFSSWPKFVTEAHARGAVTAIFTGHVYERAWQIRGYEPFLMDLIDQPAWAECLLERLHLNSLVVAKAAARAGIDLLLTGDDVANQNALMFSPAIWRRMILSRWAKVWRTAKEIHPAVRTWYHTDGNCMDIVGEMVDAGLDILNPVQPECLDADEVHRRFGKRVSFDGCIGTQSTIPFGTPADVRERVRTVIDRYGRSGGLMLAPTHVLEPEVPVANIEAFADACREFGEA